MKTFKELYTEVKIFKTGTTVWWTDQDGDDKEVKIVSYDKKHKLYVIDFEGHDMEAEPEELTVESICEAKNSAVFQGRTYKRPRNSLSDRWGARDFAMAYVIEIGDNISSISISEHESADTHAMAAVLDELISVVEKFDQQSNKIIQKANKIA